MSIKLLSVNGIENIRAAEYIVDTEDEKDNIPDEDKVQGTKVFVVENSKSYKMNSSLEWIEKEE